MTEKIEKAFPGISGPPSEYFEYNEGMTLRDYFAIHADWEDVRHYATDDYGRNLNRTVARYKYADAMIVTRKAKP